MQIMRSDHNNQANEIAAADSGHNFGTFYGVVLPSILTMLGAIMFLRVNYITGRAGLIYSLIILAVAISIVMATALSISAISSNTPVKGGGVYFLISRTLGPGFGGSIGVTLFLAQGISIPFNILGFAEAVCSDFPSAASYYLVIALATGLILGIITFTGADLAMKFQVLIFIALGIGILTMFAGALIHVSPETFQANLEPVQGARFGRLFAVFFPAVTGIMAGVNMSGDLKNPSKSIPRGIIITILLGGGLYLLEFLLYGAAFNRDDLMQNPYKIIVDNAPFGTGYLITLGVIAATISTALGLFVCAPRVLQALAIDCIFPQLSGLAKCHGVHNEPRRATLVLVIITIAILLWGGLEGLSPTGMSTGMNMVAEIASMCFLLTYAMVNLAAFVESYGANPSFRPRFRFFHWSIAMYGFVACILVAFYIDYIAATAALVIAWGLFLYIKHRQFEVDFGDARRGFLYSRIRMNLYKLARTPVHPKNWRPTMVILSSRPEMQFYMPYFATMLESDRGIISMVQFVECRVDSDAFGMRDQYRKQLAGILEQHEIYSVFPEVVVCKDFDKALYIFLQSHLVGPLKPNIVMMGFPDNEERIDQNIRHIRTIQTLHMSCVMMHNFDRYRRLLRRVVRGRVDIWWRGTNNISLMLILANLLVNDPLWQGTTLRILRVAETEKEAGELRDELEGIVESARIKADTCVFVTAEPFYLVLRRESADASAIFIGLCPPDSDEEFHKIFQRFNIMLDGMAPAFVVTSSGGADLRA